MNYDSIDFEMDDWDEDGEDEVLYESDEFREQNSPVERLPEPIISDDLPVLPLRGVVIYPMMWLPLPIGQERSIRLVEKTLPNNRIIALVTSKNEDVDEPSPGEVHHIGTAAQVHRVLKTPDGTMRLLVQGLERIRLLEYTQEEPFLRARIEIVPEVLEDGLEMEALMRAVQDLFRKLIELEPQMPDELTIMSINVDDGRQLAYLVASSMRLKVADAQALLEMDRVRDKLLRLIQLLKKELEVLELGRKIQSEAQGEMERMQREFFLREQMRAIQKELGEEDEHAADIRELEERIAAAGMSEEAEREAMRELSRMRRMPIQAAEYSVIKTYLDLMVSLPWRTATSDNLDIKHARQVLDEDHYGLAEIKERILEFLAVRKLRSERRKKRAQEPDDVGDKIRREREGLVLCFVGPPGVGKTSLGLSIARAMNRRFIRLALGGIRDEADIRGFRRTYIGAMPGRIIQSLRRIESRNPVFMLDEVDKLGRDFRGDPSSALLEVLDPEQNREFRDHYLDVPFDLSQVLFVTTANVLDTIPPALRDRMEIIQLSSYTEDEKVNIAKGYLVPRQIKENGLRPSEVKLADDALREIIQGYTREAGVRNLERQIGKVCRKIAAGVAAGEIKRGRTVKRKDVAIYLGKRRFFDEEIEERLENPGVAIGLVWTEAGGDITFFEATRVPGAKGYTLTGQLGEVMKESAQAALSYVRNRAESLGIDPEFFNRSDLHLHIPEGAIPKDGPSAGITMATALASLLTNRPVRPKLGMTGEITLRGKVLPIGGVKEKVLAAARYGLDTVILPRRNESDLDELPEAVRKQMKFVFVNTVDEVLVAALLSNEEADKSGKGELPASAAPAKSSPRRRKQPDAQPVDTRPIITMRPHQE
ncbi:MAG: endopeptidase La [Caldilinea sp.]